MISWLFDEQLFEPSIRETVIFGTGRNGMYVYRYLIERGIDVKAFCDDSPTESQIADLPVVKYDELLADFDRDIAIAITPRQAFVDIAGRLMADGFEQLYCATLYDDVPDNPGPYLPLARTPLPDGTHGPAALVFPGGEMPRSGAQRSIKAVRNRFPNVIPTIHLFAPHGFESYYADILGSPVRTYDREHVLAEYPVVVMQFSSCGEVCDPELAKKQAPLPMSRVNYIFIMDDNEFRMNCINRRVDTWLYPSSRDNVFMRQSSPIPEEHFFFFPFGILHRDSGLGPINELGFRFTDDWERLRNRQAHQKIVAVFGGSTAYSTHCFPDEMWTAQLEDKLNDKCEELGLQERFTVLNFGQPGCTVFNEMILYVSFAQSLKPEYVIAHDGSNDLSEAQGIDPSLLIRHQLIYRNMLEEWSKRLHGAGGNGLEQRDPPIPQHILKAYFTRKRQFADLATQAGSTFIWGIQPLLSAKKELSTAEADYFQRECRPNPFYCRADQLFQKVIQLSKSLEIPVVDVYTAFGQYGSDEHLFGDSCHTKPDGDERIARAYMDEFFTGHLKSMVPA